MKRMTALLLALLMLFALAACSNNNPESQQPSDGETQQDADEQQPAQNGEVKDTLVIALGADVQYLDPFLTSSMTDDCITYEIYEGLVRRATDDDEDKTPKPWVATEWEISEDGMEYTFKLRDDVVFHNGTPMTSDDVVFSMERAVESPYMASVFGQYVDHAEAIDDYTVKVIMKAPYAPFLSRLDVTFPIHSRAYWDECAEKAEAEGTTAEAVFLDHPIGTGPYMYESRELGASVSLKANPDHWSVTPAFENLEFKVITDPNTVAVAIETGEIDMAGGTASTIPATSVPLMEENPDLNVTYVPSVTTNYIAFNTKNEPTNNALFRKAVAHAIDKQFVIDVTENGNATPAVAMTCDLVFGHSDKLTGYAYDVEQAKELLAEAGYPNGEGIPTLTLKIMDGKPKSAAEVIQSNLREIGVDIEIVILEKNAFLSEVGDNKDFELAYLGISCGEDAALFAEVYTSANLTGLNLAQLDDPVVDQLFMEGDVAADNDVRLQKYEEVLLMVEEDCWYAPIYHPMNTFVTRSNIQMGPTHASKPFMFEVTLK